MRGVQWIKNYVFDYTFQRWGPSEVVFTSVAGHVKSSDFDSRYRKWHQCDPAELFDASIIHYVDQVRAGSLRMLPSDAVQDKDAKHIARNIEDQARGCRALFIWTDCDREGEHIGTEIRDIALKANPRLEVLRARFSNIERAYVA